MKKGIIIGVLTLILIFGKSRDLMAQGTTTFVSNIGQSSAGSSSAGSDSWLAAGFQTGANSGGYLLSSVQLDMSDASGVPNGFSVMIYANLNGVGLTPGTSLGILNGTANPAVAGAYTYAAVSSISLSPNAVYFIVITAGTKVATGAYQWDYAGANNYNPTGGWFSLGGGWTSANGTSWGGNTAVFSQFAINATAAPEPGVTVLLAFGGLAFGLKHWNEKKRS
jgi:hypothetical protein